MTSRTVLAAACVAAMAGLVAARQTGPEVMRIEGTSRVLIHVGKAGALGFAGHVHEVEAPVSGSVTVDRSNLANSQVVAEFDSASLRVTGRDEPPQDVPQVQQVMLSERVLDAKRYPKIVFRSKRITVTGTSGQSVTLEVGGELSLHGRTAPAVAHVRVGLKDGSLSAEGTTTVKQSAFGIEPVTAAGGSIRVKDDLDITFTVQASR